MRKAEKPVAAAVVAPPVAAPKAAAPKAAAAAPKAAAPKVEKKAAEVPKYVPRVAGSPAKSR